MVTEKDLHKTLAAFGITAIALLRKHRFFQGNFSLPISFWKRFQAASKAKNTEAFSQAFSLYTAPEVLRGMAAIDEAAGIAVTEGIQAGLPVSEILSSRPELQSVFERREARFVQLTTNTDMKKFRALTTEESLKMHDLIGENRDVNEVEFAKQPGVLQLVDGNGYRARMTKRTESHGATEEESYYYALDNGATEKERITAGDDKVRDTHSEDADAGRIPIDEPYPASGEMWPGEKDINCRCRAAYYFDEVGNADQEAET